MTQAPPALLTIPDIDEDADTLSAALAYANAGWYVLPVTRGSKHPGSVLGASWHRQSTRDPQMIAALWAGTDHGIALHCGRSGAVVFDVDDPSALTPELIRAIIDTPHPHQSTRADVRGRGHHLFLMPQGRTLGNSNGQLGKAWGEVRGANGVIIVAPSVHARADAGGRYEWATTGVVPPVPDEVLALLPDASPAADAAPDRCVAAFLSAHAGGVRPELVDAWVATFRRDVAEGASRHASMVSKLAGAMKEAKAGLIDAGAAVRALGEAFVAAVGAPPSGPRQGPPRGEHAARAEFAGILAWAVGQALAADDAATIARVATHGPTAGEHLIATTPTRKAQPWDTTAPPTAAPTPSSASPTASTFDPTPPPGTSASLRVDLMGGTNTGTSPISPDADSASSAGESSAIDDDPHAATRRTFPRIDWHELWNAPDEEDWILEPILPVGRLVALYSAPKVGKSLLMLEMAVAVSKGIHWGLSVPERRYRVLYVDFENDPRGDVRQRLRSMRYGPDDLDHLDYLSFPTMGALDSERGGKELLAAAHAYGSEVVVIDTISRAVAGEENDNDTWLNMYRQTGMKLKAAGISMIRLDHSGKDTDRGMRGGSAKVGDVDMVWRLSTITDGKRYRLECTDSRLLVEQRDLELIRHPYPLRHTIDALGIDADLEEKLERAIAICDAAGLPDDAGRRKVSAVLTKAGFKLRAASANDVARRRRDRSLRRVEGGPEGGSQDGSHTPEFEQFEGTALTCGNPKVVPSPAVVPGTTGTTRNRSDISAGQSGSRLTGTAGNHPPPGARWSPSPSPSIEGEGDRTPPRTTEQTWKRAVVAGEQVRVDTTTGEVIPDE